MRREDIERGLLRKQITHFSSQIVIRASTCLPFLPVFPAEISIKFLTVIHKCHNCIFFLIFICCFMHLFFISILFIYSFYLFLFTYYWFLHYFIFRPLPSAIRYPPSVVCFAIMIQTSFLKNTITWGFFCPMAMRSFESTLYVPPKYMYSAFT